MKKILSLILIPFFIFSLGACAKNAEENVSEKKNTDVNSDIIIEETLLFEQDGIKVSAAELVKLSDWNWELKLLIENKSEKNIGVQCNSASINSYMISEFFSCSVPKKSTSDGTIYFSPKNMEAAQISTISDIVMSFHVFNSDNYTTLFDTDEIELRTSAYNTDLTSPAGGGKVLYEKDGIRIIGQNVRENNFGGKTVVLLIENNFGENITVRCENLSVNGIAVTPFLSCTINNGRKALDEITMLSSDLEKHNIEVIKNVELTFRIINPKTYETIAETEPITYYIS